MNSLSHTHLIYYHIKIKRKKINQKINQTIHRGKTKKGRDLEYILKSLKKRKYLMNTLYDIIN